MIAYLPNNWNLILLLVCDGQCVCNLFLEPHIDKSLILTLLRRSCSGKVAERANEHLPQLIAQNPALKNREYEETIKSALREEDLLPKEYASGKDESAFSGITVCIYLVDRINGLLTAGNLGDAHIILGEADSLSNAEQVHTACISPYLSHLHKGEQVSGPRLVCP